MIKISFHNVDSSDSLTSFIKQKTRKLRRFLDQKVELNWTVNTDGNLFSPRLNIHSPHKLYVLESRSDNAYKAVSEILEKAKNLLSKKKINSKKGLKLNYT